MTSAKNSTAEKGPKAVPYTFDDIVAAMREIAPFDWRTFFTERLNTHGPGAPLGGIENGGWKLAFNETMNEQNEQQALHEAAFHVTDVRFSLGMQVRNSEGEVWDLIPGSPAAQAGIAPDMKLVAVNWRKWSPKILRTQNPAYRLIRLFSIGYEAFRRRGDILPRPALAFAGSRSSISANSSRSTSLVFIKTHRSHRAILCHAFHRETPF